eukprot:CAMPEP_0201729516 /NCGR_PEP_ID=MMETSP0593-20130828/19339_1 /ASSEMBLY_ACC=CAM_ASM_000672 /TAXON_ID=267983 /ORGANISM="Skeletonema japonicum, Strain CCMP2506" /LENGTH=218 /DNA_ID=CAMNT_0048221873 /DNA_START=34 /DNA_END=690 /DNA_ORIENTATION=-
MPSNRPVNKEGIDVMEHQQEQEPDFFSLFGLPSYEDGVNFGSSITSSIRRPMSAILAVVDNALAVLNEEFDSSENRTMASSSSSSYSEAQEQVTDINSSGTKSVRGCHRRTRRTKTSKMRTIDTSTSSTSKGDKLNNVDSLSDSDDVQSSVIGSISKLELHDDYIEREQKKAGINSNISDNLQGNLVSDLEKRIDSSEYFMVESDRETKDGWLVVIDQ